MAQVDINIGSHKITAEITRDAFDEHELRVGETAIALGKAPKLWSSKTEGN